MKVRAKFPTWAVTYMMSPTLVGCAKARLSRDPVSKCPLRPMRLAAMYAHCSIHRITCNTIPSTQPETMTRQLKDGGWLDGITFDFHDNSKKLSHEG